MRKHKPNKQDALTPEASDDDLVLLHLVLPPFPSTRPFTALRPQGSV
jgi:hypothetical protein